MKPYIYLALGLFVLLTTACQAKKEKQNSETKTSTKGTEIINEAIQKHGGDLYKTAHYSFDFRGKTYTFEHQQASYIYTVSSESKNKKTLDVLDNGKFTRSIHQQKINLSNAESNRYSAALNSVLYFALLPYKLNDAAVIKEYKGEIMIFDQPFYVVEVTFKQEGGGEDHNDIFYFWIHQEQKTVDFLAYKYHVDGGGIRFRKAYNVRKVEGVLFQNYINYAAPLDSPMTELPILLQNNKLKEVSKIELKNIKYLN